MKKINFSDLKDNQIFLVEVSGSQFVSNGIQEIVKVHEKNSGKFQILSGWTGSHYVKNFDEDICWLTDCEMVKINKEQIEKGRWRNMRGRKTTLEALYFINQKKIEKMKKMVKKEKEKRDNKLQILKKEFSGFTQAMKTAGMLE